MLQTMHADGLIGWGRVSVSGGMLGVDVWPGLYASKNREMVADESHKSIKKGCKYATL